ncbi:putative ethylene-responsive binding factor-associated repression, Ninja family [Helianthus debilis subsp. tardiflorus]
MGDRTSNEMENLSLQTKSPTPRDLLQRFTKSSDPDEDIGSGSGEEVELNLGLSLGGRFGVDKNNNNKLLRSSSIAAILPVARDDDVLSGGHENLSPGPGPGRGYSGLIRTSSLPVETEEEWRKRKELQSLRRLAAKRRRSEKQKSLTRGERDEYVTAMGRVGSSPGPLFGSGKWPPRGGGGGLSPEGGVSELENSRCRQGSSGRGGETSSLSQESSSGSNPRLDVEVEGGSSDRKKAGKEVGSMEDMPCVFTQGDGPNGRVVEGILYKYGKGEQVKIMCVCHGSFLSPAEFVRHAGGTDFVHPLKHIVVKPGSSFS